MSLLRLEDDRSVEREVSLARVEILRAALAAIADFRGDTMADLLGRRYEVVLERAEAGLAADEGGKGARADAARSTFACDAEIVRQATTAERQRLIALRADGTIGDAAFQQIEQELDLEELDLQQLAPG
jgi:CPA1 family monovalent cation:H+ antiporter